MTQKICFSYLSDCYMKEIKKLKLSQHCIKFPGKALKMNGFMMPAIPNYLLRHCLLSLRD